MEVLKQRKLNIVAFRKRMEECVSSEAMISALGIFSALCHIAGWTLFGMTVLALIFIFVFISEAKLRGCLPPLCLLMYVISPTDGAVGAGNTGGAVFMEYLWYFALLGVLGIAAAIYGAVRRKLFRVRITFGTIGIMAMGLSFILGGILCSDFLLANFETQDAYASVNLAIGVVMAIYFLLFFVVLGMIAPTLQFDYIAKTTIVASLVVVFQLFYHLILVNALNGTLDKNSIEIGWGKSNNLALMIALGLPFSAYYMGVAKHPSIAFGALLVQMSGILFTLSRGMLLIAVPFAVGAIVYAVIRSKGRSRLELSVLTLAFVAVVSLYVFLKWERFATLLNHYIELGFEDAGRTPLYEDAWETFLRQPFFGAGYGYKLGVRPTTYFYLVHNIILQFAMCSGVLGLFAITLHIIASGVICFVRPNEERTYLMIGAILIFAHSMLDVMWFYPYAQLYYMLFLAKAEQDCIEKSGFGLVWEKKLSANI